MLSRWCSKTAQHRLPHTNDCSALALPLHLDRLHATATDAGTPESRAAADAAEAASAPTAQGSEADQGSAATHSGRRDTSTNRAAQPGEQSTYKGSRPHAEGRDPTFDRFPIACEGMCRSATHRDIARAFSHIGVHPKQCRVQLDDFFQPMRWYVTFQTKAEQVAALKGGPYPMGSRRMYVEMTSMNKQLQQTFHPFAQNSMGRFVFISDIQENATMTDLMRFVDGYSIMEAGLTFMRVTGDKKLVTETSPHKQPRHRAVVRFISAEIAARAVRELHGQYLLNTPVAMRLIH